MSIKIKLSEDEVVEIIVALCRSVIRLGRESDIPILRAEDETLFESVLERETESRMIRVENNEG